MGGGGFSAGIEDASIDMFALSLTETTTPRICLLPTASGDPEEQIGRFYAFFQGRACEASHVSLFRLGQLEIDLRDFLLGAGPDLRRRRVAAEPAGDLAGPRARRDPARRLGGGDRAVRPVGRRDVLVRARRHDVDRAADPGRGARLPARQHVGALVDAAAPPADLPPGDPRRRPAARATASTTAPRSSTRGAGSSRSSRRARTPAPRASSSTATARSSRRRSTRACSSRSSRSCGIAPRWPSPSCARCARCTPGSGPAAAETRPSGEEKSPNWGLSGDGRMAFGRRPLESW